MLIRGDGFISTNINIPEGQRHYRIFEGPDFNVPTTRPMEFNLDDRVQMRMIEFHFVGETPRGLRIFEQT